MLKIEGLNLKRGGKLIINNVSFEVIDGEIFGILGANGAGKSSLAYVLMGSSGYVPDNGKITFNGIDITHKTIDERARLGITMAWQEPARFEGIPIMDFILLGSKEKGHTLAEGYMDNMRLTVSEYRARQVDKTLSGGERIKEIGVRRAVGAKRRDILIQFLSEALLLSIGGGIIGVALGVVIAALTAIFAKLPLIIPVDVVELSFLATFIIGVFFGVYPARKAALLDPIKALQFE
jgi:ABC-type branched-subunit amino acid transport system ATPase component